MSRAIRPAEADDWEAVADLRRAAFAWAGERAVLDGMWVLESDGRVAACARLEAEGQWFGGRAVPTGLVSSVAVAPEARGRGLGGELLRGVLHEARDLGLPRLALFPSAVRPYRRAGFEIAGAAVAVSVDAAVVPRSGAAAVGPLTDADLPAVRACYERAVAARPGAIARSERWWTTRVLAGTPPTPRATSEVFGFVVRNGAAIEGYVIYGQVPTGDDAYAVRLVCRDLAWETEAAGRALLGLLASGHPMTLTVEWLGSSIDPATFLLDAPPRVVSAEPWMARLVDPLAAIRAQGFAPGVGAEITTLIVDPVEPAWTVGARIRIHDGRAEAQEADVRDGAQIESGTLAAILAGAMDPATAVTLGRLTPGAGGIAAFDALRPTGRPWIGDRF